MRIRRHRNQGTAVLNQGMGDERLQRQHLRGSQSNPNDAVGAKDLLRAVRVETRDQQQPGIAPERCDQVARAAMEQIAPIAEAEQQVACLGEFPGHRFERCLQVGHRDADVHVPAALDEIKRWRPGGGCGSRRHHRPGRRAAAGSKRGAGDQYEERGLRS
jgi:hypothetical protein